MQLGVDVGGTFTDAALVAAGETFTAKAPTTPQDQSQGVIEAVRAVLAAAGADATAVVEFGHAMTVGTNALLEQSGGPIALVATRGFTDLLEVARQDRPSLYHLNQAKPEPLVRAEMRFPVAERCDPRGVVEPLTEEEVERVAAAVVAAQPSAVAICLLFAYLHPEHERKLSRALRRALPGVPVSASSEVLAQFREFERCSTTVIDAYLAPLLGRYLRRLQRAAEAEGLPSPQIMRSSGGLMRTADAIGSGAWSVLSGPAAGSVGAAWFARESGDGQALGFDMGGTSCDVCVVEGGDVRRTDRRLIGGRTVQLPMVDVHTVGAGGGSIAWRDPGGVLRVGPRSAGAEPGPACYGRGGREPTVTDANLLLGRLTPDAELPGGLRLDRDRAEAAIAPLAARLDLDPVATAEGIIRVANQEMLRALRRITVERGIDPRHFSLLPFGGAGPMHAAEIAEELGITRLICPRAGGTLSALGLCLADRRFDTARTVMLRGSRIEQDRVAAAVEELAAPHRADLPQARVEVTYALRYRGQAFEIDIAGAAAPRPADLRDAFEAEHERRYGFRDAGAEIELVTIKVAVIAAGRGQTEPGQSSAVRDPQRHERAVRFRGRWRETTVLRGELPAQHHFDGPLIAEMPGSTLVLGPGWSAVCLPSGTVVAERSQP